MKWDGCSRACGGVWTDFDVRLLSPKGRLEGEAAVLRAESLGGGVLPKQLAKGDFSEGLLVPTHGQRAQGVCLSQNLSSW